MKNRLNEKEKNRLKCIRDKIFKSIILGLTGYFFSKLVNINVLPLTLIGIFAAFGYDENEENKIFKGKIYSAICILTFGVFYIVAQAIEFFIASLVGIYNLFIDASWVLNLIKKYSKNIKITNKEKLKEKNIEKENINKKVNKEINKEINKDKNKIEDIEVNEINNLLKKNKIKKVNSYDDDELLELAAIDEFNELENNEDDEDYLYDTNDFDNEDSYCENCFKKISKEEYELNDGMCEECFDDIHYDENGNFKEDYYDDI